MQSLCRIKISLKTKFLCRILDYFSSNLSFSGREERRKGRREGGRREGRVKYVRFTILHHFPPSLATPTLHPPLPISTQPSTTTSTFTNHTFSAITPFTTSYHIKLPYILLPVPSIPLLITFPSPLVLPSPLGVLGRGRRVTILRQIPL